MIYGGYYQMTDARTDAMEGAVLADDEVVTLKPTPGGILYFNEAGDGRFLEWDDEATDTFVDNEAAGTLVVTTKQGSVLFTKVDLS